MSKETTGKFQFIFDIIDDELVYNDFVRGIYCDFIKEEKATIKHLMEERNLKFILTEKLYYGNYDLLAKENGYNGLLVEIHYNFNSDNFIITNVGFIKRY